MASLNISRSDPLCDDVQNRIGTGQYGSVGDDIRDLIRRDQGRISDGDRWLHDLDISLAETLAERDAGGGIDLDAACDAIAATLGHGAAHSSIASSVRARTSIACWD